MKELIVGVGASRAISRELPTGFTSLVLTTVSRFLSKNELAIVDSDLLVDIASLL